MSESEKGMSGAKHLRMDSSCLVPPGIMFLTEQEAQKKGEYQRGVEGWEAFRRDWIYTTRELKERMRRR